MQDISLFDLSIAVFRNLDFSSNPDVRIYPRREDCVYEEEWKIINDARKKEVMDGKAIYCNLVYDSDGILHLRVSYKPDGGYICPHFMDFEIKKLLGIFKDEKEKPNA